MLDGNGRHLGKGIDITWIGKERVGPQLQRAGALQDASRPAAFLDTRQRRGVRWPSTALEHGADWKPGFGECSGLPAKG